MIDGEGNRYHLWPIRLGWRRGGCGPFFGWHGWQTGAEVVSIQKTSRGCMPGYRRTFGVTIHVGALKIMLGPDLKGGWRWPWGKVRP